MRHSSRLVRVLAALAATACVLGQGSARAATPSAGTISAGSPTTSWQGQFYDRAQTFDPILCTPQALDPINAICDHFQLTVQDAGVVTVSISWPSPGCQTNPTNVLMVPCSSADINDFDLYVYDSTNTIVASSANTGPTEGPVTFTATAGATYEVRVIPFDVTLSDYQGTATLVQPGGGQGGGIDPAVSIGNARIAEGDAGTSNMTFPLTLDHATIAPLTVNYVTADPTVTTDPTATAGVDYVPQAGTVVFAPGQTSATLTVPIIGDLTPEPNQAFMVRLFLPDPPLVVAKIADAQGIGTIVNDDWGRIVRGSGTVGNALTGQGSFALRATEWQRWSKVTFRQGAVRFYSSQITSITFNDLTHSARIEGSGWNAGHSVSRFAITRTRGAMAAVRVTAPPSRP